MSSIKTVVFRVDASVDIGFGHLSRCLTLADGLRNHGWGITFVSRDLIGNGFTDIQRRGYQLWQLPAPITPSLNFFEPVPSAVDAEETLQVLQGTQYENIDWLIVDHYGIFSDWDIRLRERTKRIFVVDDTAIQHRECDLLLNQNYLPGIQADYAKVAKGAQLLLGPQYALLSPEYKQYRKQSRVRSRRRKNYRVLVFYGGGDRSKETEKMLQVIQKNTFPDFHFDVVVGPSNIRKDSIEQAVSKISNASFYYNVPCLAELMSNADIAFGAGGSTHWERLCLGVPAFVTLTAENQRNVSYQLDADNFAVKVLGDYETVTTEDITEVCMHIAEQDIFQYLEKGKTVVDGNGVEKVIQAMDEFV